MQFDILTIFPKIFDSYLNESIIKRAKKNKKISIKIHNIRDYTVDKHNKVDDRPYGGGPGMVLKVVPIYNNLKAIRKVKKSKVILLSPKGKTFNQKMAQKFSKYNQLVLIAGHYEGFDERIKKYVDEEISVGNYILTGGELPVMTIIDAVTRLLPGVLGDADSNKDETFTKSEKYIEHPHYTRPEKFQGQSVPKVLMSGNHHKIASWRAKKSKNSD